MRRILAAFLLVSPAVLAPACDRPSALCEQFCDCEHCNDIVDNRVCATIDASNEIAIVYGCEAQWDTYADCFENEGVCDVQAANYSTRNSGNCSLTADSGLPCQNNADCLGVGVAAARCENTTCVFDACDDGSGIPCVVNSDCPSGDDKCEEQLAALTECVTTASSDPSLLIIGFGN